MHSLWMSYFDVLYIRVLQICCNASALCNFQSRGMARLDISAQLFYQKEKQPKLYVAKFCTNAPPHFPCPNLAPVSLQPTRRRRRELAEQPLPRNLATCEMDLWQREQLPRQTRSLSHAESFADSCFLEEPKRAAKGIPFSTDRAWGPRLAHCARYVCMCGCLQKYYDRVHTCAWFKGGYYDGSD